MRTKKKEKYNVVKFELKLEHNSWFDYYDGYYQDFDNYYYDNYTYIKNISEESFLVGNIFRKSIKTRHFPYSIVDINSIYTKQERRNKLIDELLGIENPKVVYKPTFADIKIKKNDRNS